MARHKMFVDCSLAAGELGFHAGNVDNALSRAAHWYVSNNFVRHRLSAEAASPAGSGEILKSNYAGRADHKR
jgi:hypothetical protein